MCPQKNEGQIYKLIWCKKKETATNWDLHHLVVWHCGIWRSNCKALTPSATIPCRGTKDESSSATLSMDFAQTLCLPVEILKDTQDQTKSSQIPPDFPLLTLDVCHLGRACSPLLSTWPSLLAIYHLDHKIQIYLLLQMPSFTYEGTE